MNNSYRSSEYYRQRPSSNDLQLRELIHLESILYDMTEDFPHIPRWCDILNYTKI